MKIKEAKENVIENFRRLNYPDHHEIEIFLLNTLEKFEDVVKHEERIRILNEINEMNNTDEDVWTGNEVKQHLINFITKLG